MRICAAALVLILSGAQFGLPLSDDLVASAVSTLKEKGVSANDIYSENLDLVRNDDPRWRAALASMDERYEALMAAIGNFDFDRALECLSDAPQQEVQRS